jgi:alpha-N-arabinofuranosidase
MSLCTIRLCADMPGAVINPNIYGHFAEHSGRCIYEGIWVGPRSKIPNENGLRLDVLAALKQLRAPVIRWPGGCFAGTYHWRDGVGPADQRPQTANIRSQQAEPNTFGTGEFLQLCSAAGSEAFVCLNVGSGSVREALEWLEFCNHGGDTSITRLRSGPPHGVKYWGIGSMPWGCGGGFSAADYAREYKRYATYLRAADPGIELAACGCGTDVSADWNYEFCEAMGRAALMDHLTIQRHFGCGHGQNFTDSEYHALFGDLVALERDLDLAGHVLASRFPGKHVGIVVDEWGLRHPEANADNGFEQANTVRDAVFAGAVLNLFNRRAARVSMANLAQAINVFQSIGVTEGGRMVLTPTYYVYDMMRYHMGSRSVPALVGCDCYAAKEGHPPQLPGGVPTGCVPTPHLSASASISGSKVLLTVANQTVDRDVEARIEVGGATIAAAIGRVLTSAGPRDCNTFETPKTVFPKRIKFEPVKGELVCVFPRHSFTSLNLSLS